MVPHHQLGGRIGVRMPSADEEPARIRGALRSTSVVQLAAWETFARWRWDSKNERFSGGDLCGDLRGDSALRIAFECFLFYNSLKLEMIELRVRVCKKKVI